MSNAGHPLSIERRMAAPPEAVWRAWTEHLTEWMVAIIELVPDGDGTLYRATARHWDAESRQRHEEMGFQPGRSKVAEQLEAVAVRLATR